MPPPGIVVAGAGAFGQNHLRVLHEIGTARLAAILESNPARAEVLAREYPAVPVFRAQQELLEARSRGQVELQAACVCVPTSAHAQVAGAFLAAGLDVLIEKPIASSLEEADTLIALAESNGCLLQVGHLERFNPAVLAVRSRIHRPMFFEAHRLSVFTPRALDVDVVLDLMIHDLDIVLSLVDSPVRSLEAVGLPVLSGKVDIANVRIEFESGCVANFTASRVSTERIRKLRFFQPHQYISIDYARQDLLFIDVKPSAPGDPAALQGRLSLAKPEVTPGEPLRLEIESFIESVRTRRAPVVSGREGREALALALRINESIRQHAERAHLERFV